jgi:hypothetical protein
MNGRVRIENEGTIYEREFDTENEDRAQATLKEILADVDERFLKTSRREPSPARKKSAVKPAEPSGAERGGEL